ncbi:hypothetical protein ACFLZV_03725 [Candidatus Margulisiibacteriota bacterium]
MKTTVTIYLIIGLLMMLFLIKQVQAYDVDKVNFVQTYLDLSEIKGPKIVEKELQKAKAIAADMIKMEPLDPTGYFLYGGALGQLTLLKPPKDQICYLKKIEGSFNKALSLKKDFVPALYCLGMYYRNIAKLNFFIKFWASSLGAKVNYTFEDTLRMFNRALMLSPDNIRIKYQIAQTYKLMNEKEKYVSQLKNILLLSPKNTLDKYYLNQVKGLAQ